MKHPFDESQIAGIRKWVSTREPHVQECFAKYPPGLYRCRYGSVNQVALLIGFDEDPNTKSFTARIEVLEEYNPGLGFEREVFGIDLQNLTPISIVEMGVSKGA